ncbi:McrC family protein [Pantoea sp. GbtcB22]|uniref:McrC family protein n=1 Tax=Pantoea sp. GbtcB22 TaxID=2824767 RepID=UPI001C2F5B95
MERQWITVREYAHLTTPVTPGMVPTLDHAQISPSAFDWLCKLQAGFTDSGARLIVLDNRRTLRLDSYVGTISTPCGTDIEILPKHFSSTDDIEKSRQLMCRLIASAFNLPWREAGVADLNLFHYPLSEWVIRQFLITLGQLIKRGLRFDYQQVEDEQPFLRGQLDMGRQLRQLPGSQHRFHQRHYLFLPDRPENRLLRLALDKICLETRESQNWRLSHELINLMQEVPPSRQVNKDFARWGNDRLMMHYRAVRPWCQLILGEQLPLAIQGTARGISLLFPMERLFEQHVARVLKYQILSGATLHSQTASEYLCRYDDTKMFLLKPDLVLMHGDNKWVLDTKWKRLDQGNDDNCRFSQSDVYQMLAYGMRYLQPQQDLLLIYPKSSGFSMPLGPYILPNELRLHALPFDLDNDLLLGSEAVRMPLDRLG